MAVQPTLRELKNLSMPRRKSILEYIRDMDVYMEVESEGLLVSFDSCWLKQFSPGQTL